MQRRRRKIAQQRQNNKIKSVHGETATNGNFPMTHPTTFPYTHTRMANCSIENI